MLPARWALNCFRCGLQQYQSKRPFDPASRFCGALRRALEVTSQDRERSRPRQSTHRYRASSGVHRCTFATMGIGDLFGMPRCGSPSSVGLHHHATWVRRLRCEIQGRDGFAVLSQRGSRWHLETIGQVWLCSYSLRVVWMGFCEIWVSLGGGNTEIMLGDELKGICA
jgi:hypothetical protein